jgi:hypothetical protein
MNTEYNLRPYLSPLMDYGSRYESFQDSFLFLKFKLKVALQHNTTPRHHLHLPKIPVWRCRGSGPDLRTYHSQSGSNPFAACTSVPIWASQPGPFLPLHEAAIKSLVGRTARVSTLVAANKKGENFFCSHPPLPQFLMLKPSPRRTPIPTPPPDLRHGRRAAACPGLRR